MIPSCRLAILHIDLTWSDHVRLDDKVIPRYFTVGEGEIMWPAMMRLIGGAFLDRLMESSLVLE